MAKGLFECLQGGLGQLGIEAINAAAEGCKGFLDSELMGLLQILLLEVSKDWWKRSFLGCTGCGAWPTG